MNRRRILHALAVVAFVAFLTFAVWLGRNGEPVSQAALAAECWPQANHR